MGTPAGVVYSHCDVTPNERGISRWFIIWDGK
jgi:hypothetical protein